MSQFGNNTGIEVPTAVIEQLGGGRRPAVVVTVNGFTYRSTVGVMAGKHLIPFSADKRRDTGLGGGDDLTVDVEIDTAPRTIEVPDDLAGALASAGLRSAFDALSPSAQKAHVTAVTGAKALETRQRRVERVIGSLS